MGVWEKTNPARAQVQWRRLDAYPANSLLQGWQNVRWHVTEESQCQMELLRFRPPDGARWRHGLKLTLNQQHLLSNWVGNLERYKEPVLLNGYRACHCAYSTLESSNLKLETWRMSLPADYHMHTPLCRHARGEPEEYARHALQLGFKEIGFSDHAPMPQDDFDNWRMNADKLDDYVAMIRRVQKDFPQLVIRLALEVDYLPGYEDWIRDLASRHPWDYFIGSVHYVSDSWAIDDPQKVSEWKHRDSREVWTIYFERLKKAAETGLFEIIGHADLPKKFGHRPPDNFTAHYREFLEAARKHNCAVELNTAGLRKDCREIYPSREILQLALQTGVPVTFGSDAHAPEEVGMNFAEAVQLARSAGYKDSLRFELRKRKTVPF